MRSILISTVIIASYFAAPVVEEPVFAKKVEKVLTVEELDGYLNVVKMFRDMLPQQLMSTIEGLTSLEKGEIVSLITDWFQGKIKKPTNKAEIVELIKEKLPTAFTKLQSLNNTFYEKFNALKPETQTLLRTWRDKVVSVHGATPGEAASQQLQLMTDFANEIQKMDPATKEDLRTQFPSAVKLTEGLGFTVLTTFAIIVQKISESLTPHIQVTAKTVECTIPLD